MSDKSHFHEYISNSPGEMASTFFPLPGPGKHHSRENFPLYSARLSAEFLPRRDVLSLASEAA